MKTSLQKKHPDKLNQYCCVQPVAKVLRVVGSWVGFFHGRGTRNPRNKLKGECPVLAACLLTNRADDVSALSVVCPCGILFRLRPVDTDSATSVCKSY